MPIEELIRVATRALERSHVEEANALFHAITMLEPRKYEGYLGLAECAERRGHADDAVEILVTAAGQLADQPSPAAGYILLGKALKLDPGRLDLHVDIARLQAKDGDVYGARSRLEQLAAAYIHLGEWGEAQNVLAFAAKWDPQPLVAGEIEISIDIETDSGPIALDDIALEKISAAVVREAGSAKKRRRVPQKTMVAETVLRFPDGSPMPTKDQPWAVAAARKSPTSRPRKRTKTGPTRKVDTGQRAAVRARARARRRRAEAITARTEPVPSRLRKLPRPT